MRHFSSFGCLLFATGALAAWPALSATQIGVTSAVIPAARGTPTDSGARVLQVGLDMTANERVQTDAGGKAHLLFLDGSALSIGPNSDVVLDEYVYDPDSRTGKIALSATRGVFRLVGGAISKTTPVTLRTPQATIGVRGGIATVSVGGEGVNAAFVYGEEMVVEGGGSTQRVERPGFSIATGPDGAPQPPEPLTQDMVDQQNAAFEGDDEPAPDAPPVSDDDVANSQISALNSTTGLGDVAPAAGGGGSPTPPAAPDETTEASQDALTDAAAMQPGGGDEGSPGGGDPGAGPQEPSPPEALTLLGTFVGRAKHASVPSQGTDDQSLSNNVDLENGAVLNGVFSASGQAVDDFVFAINAAEGGFEASSTQQPFGEGELSGTGLLSPEQDFLLYTLMDQADGHKVLAFAGVATPQAAVPTSGIWSYVLQDDFVRGQTLPFIEDPSGGQVSLANGYIAWNDSDPNAIRAFGAGAISILGQGAAQQSAGTVLTGAVLSDEGSPFIFGRMLGQRRTGSSGAADPTTFFSSPISSSDASDGSDFFGATGPRNFVLEASRVDLSDQILDRGGLRFADAASGAVTDYFPNTPALQGAPFTPGQRSTRNLNGFAAALESRYTDGVFSTQRLATSNNLSDVQITTNAEQNKVSAVFNLQADSDETSVVMEFGATSLGGEAFIDDHKFMAQTNGTVTVNGDPNVSGLLAMVTSSELQHDNFLPAGVSFCDCDFLTWGFFFGRRENNLADNRVIELGTWVAGLPSDLQTQMPGTQMSASYSGHVIAGVDNGGAVYQAVGSILLNFTFAIEGGNSFQLDGVTITNFDGMTITGVANTDLGNTNFYDTLLSGPGLTGALRGALFGPGAPPENAGGSVTLLGTAYRAYGTFAATR